MTLIGAAAKPSVRVRICPITEAPEHSLLQFYHRVYPERSALFKKNWRWLYRVGGKTASSLPLVALAHDKVVAHVGTTPVVLGRDHDQRRASWDTDFAVLPEYRKQNAGKALMQALMKQSPLHIAFGDDQSVAVLRELGWRTRHDTRSYQLLLRPERHPRLRTPALAPVSRVGGALTRAVWNARSLSAPPISLIPASAYSLAPFANQGPESGLGAVRSPEFLTWRVLQSPVAAEHYVLECPFSRKTSYRLLARLSETEGYRRLHLLSLSARPWREDKLSQCFAGVIHWALRAGVHRILMVTSNPAIAKVARFWFPISGALNFLYYAHDETGWEYLNSPLHQWECLDSDFDISI
jgi:GNAT superfamily N-acetyltransferase